MKKGFTLIELLAVIVILAIIAIIATPIVLDIINDSKESATLRSAEFYVDAVRNKIMQENMKSGGKLNPEECIVDTSGNVTCDGTHLEIEVNGEKPAGGSITFDKGKGTNMTLTFGDKTVIMNENGELVLSEVEQSICTLVSGEANEIGSKYSCEVKDGTKYKFYVLSKEEDGTTNLIMDNNICEDGSIPTATNTCLVAWYSFDLDNSYGPVTAITYLHNATKSWENIPNIIVNYTDENINSSLEKGTSGYGGIVTTGNITKITNKIGEETQIIENLKARIPKYEEVSDYKQANVYLYDNLNYPVCYNTEEEMIDSEDLDNGMRADNNYCYSYDECNACDYMSGINNTQINHIKGVFGYWTLSSSDNYEGFAWNLRYYGKVYDYHNDTYISSAIYGVRPVINIKL